MSGLKNSNKNLKFENSKMVSMFGGSYLLSFSGHNLFKFGHGYGYPNLSPKSSRFHK